MFRSAVILGIAIAFVAGCSGNTNDSQSSDRSSPAPNQSTPVHTADPPTPTSVPPTPVPTDVAPTTQPSPTSIPALTVSINHRITSPTNSAPVDVSFSADVSGQYDSIIWDFGDDSTSTELTPNHIFTEAGRHTVQLTLTDGTGQRVSSNEVVVEVEPGPVATVEISSSVSVQVNQTVIVDAIARDEFGNAVTDHRIIWSSDGPIDLDQDGHVRARTSAGLFPDALLATVSNTSSADLVQKFDVEVLPGPISTVGFAPDVLEFQVGESIQLTPFAYDEFGNRFNPELYSFSSRSQAGRFDEKDVFVAGRVAGVFEDEIRLEVVSGSVRYVETGSLVLNPGPPLSLDLNPELVIGTPGETTEFQLTAKDRFGNPITGSSVTWKSDIGEFEADGLLRIPENLEQGGHYRVAASMRVGETEIRSESTVLLGPVSYTLPSPTRLGHGRAYATLLSGGDVLVSGGNEGPGDIVEIYLAVPKQFQIIEGSQCLHNIGNTAVALTDGRVLLTGGIGSTGIRSTYCAEVFDPEDRSLVRVSDMNYPRMDHSMVLLEDGRVLVIGGSESSEWNDNNWVHQAEIFDPSTGEFTVTGSLVVPRRNFFAGMLPDGRVFITGGNGPKMGCTGATELYYPDSETFFRINDRHSTICEATGAILDDGGVFTMGASGSNFDAEVYRASTGWVKVNSAGSYQNRVRPTAVRLANGKVLITGGKIGGPNPGSVINSAWLYDPETNFVRDTAPMVQERQEHAMVLLPDGTVLIVGGNIGWGGTSITSAELYVPEN